MKYELKDFHHGQRVSCMIENSFVEGKISINSIGYVFICQDTEEGTSTANKLGYKFSWLYLSEFAALNVTKIVLHPRTIKDGLMEGDIIVDDSAYESQILAMCGRGILISEAEDFNTAANWCTLTELINASFTLKGETKEGIVPTYTVDELKLYWVRTLTSS